MRGAEGLGQLSMDMEPSAGASEAVGGSTQLARSAGAADDTIRMILTISMMVSWAGLLGALCGAPERFRPVSSNDVLDAQHGRALLCSFSDLHCLGVGQNLS